MEDLLDLKLYPAMHLQIPHGDMHTEQDLPLGSIRESLTARLPSFHIRGLTSRPGCLILELELLQHCSGGSSLEPSPQWERLASSTMDAIRAHMPVCDGGAAISLAVRCHARQIDAGFLLQCCVTNSSHPGSRAGVYLSPRDNLWDSQPGA
jgi:hypothetical protein